MHFKGKKKEEIQKTKLPKHVERFFFLKKIREKGNGQRKGDFFLDKTEKRYFHSFTESCTQRKTQKRKVNEKGGKDSLEKKTHQIKEKTQGRKNIRKTMKKAEKQELRGDFLRGTIFISQNIFQKKIKKRQIKKQKRISQNIEKKEVKKMRTRKKRKIERNSEKQDLQKVQKE